ncbi:MAG: hypothetical protein IK100_09625 [Muribaculaceae bacterium]|nr:hypothetical protein [Muribaculaceae bacterium]
MKTIVNIILGIGSMLALNENLEALWLNVIGIGCFALLLVINPDATVFSKK